MSDQRRVAGFFDEDLDARSMMRLLSFMSMIGALITGILTASTGIVIVAISDTTTIATNLVLLSTLGQVGILITLLFLVGAFVPKAFQKVVENKYFLAIFGMSDKNKVEITDQTVDNKQSTKVE